MEVNKLKDDSDFKNQGKPESHLEQKGKYIMNFGMDTLASSLILSALVGSSFLYANLDKFFAPLNAANSSYIFPTLWQLIPQALLFTIPIYIYHYLLQKILINFTEGLLDPIIKKDCDANMLEVYKVKLCSTFFKLSFYFFSTILGLYIFSDQDFFPTTLGGKGQYINMFKSGYPNMFYLEKAPLFDLYYQINLSFVFYDCYLLLSHPVQTDFLFMVFHHICTVSLIVFSFITNFSPCGIVIYFLHYVGDIFVYSTRLAVQSKAPEYSKPLCGIILVLCFLYTRIYVYGGLIYDYILYLPGPWTAIEYAFVGLKTTLFLLHIMWTFMILLKLCKYFVSRDVEDIYKMKKHK